ncbi:MAG: tetratricopeptide repeat protein, partial [Desulfobacula sp.]|nr:tetratricopeptide repeat protein [Desulfobacula sp.]
FIDKATVHEKTVNDARTWYYAGNIYLDIHRSQDEKYKNLDKDALNKANDSYMKCMELDDNKEFYQDLVPRILLCGEEFFNQGANYFNVGLELKKSGNEADMPEARTNFNSAVSKFDKAIDVYSKVGNTDTLSFYYRASAADMGENYPVAKESYEKLLNEFNYGTPAIYNSLFNIYFKADMDTLKAKNFIAIARTKFPQSLPLVIDEINIYLATGETEKALNSLNLAMKMDTANPTIFFAVGSMLDKEIVSDTLKSKEVREDAFKRAEDAYKKAIALDPNYFDAIYNIGALYVNKASVLFDAAALLPLDQQDEYEVIMSEADELLNLSLPHLEKAHEINAEDVSTLIALKEIYTRLKMNDKLMEVNKKLKQ